LSSCRNREIDLSEIAAVIFDTDGVLTDTAIVHAQTWKQLFDEYLKKRSERSGEKLQLFDINNDYLRYVDGKPRYDGVKSFLESRGISLPQGSPGDSPDEETICGLGNRKNRSFVERLRREGAKPYDSSIGFIQQLKTRGLRTAVISASRNAEEVLKSAGILGLFDVKVDGIDSDELQLKGKPDPAIFLEAARRLGVKPEETVIVEDALAGVEAGRRGKFRLVIGVDRTGQGEELKKCGADIEVRKSMSGKTIESLPSALKKKEEIFRLLHEKTPVIFLDYDGTLTPIVEDPAEAKISEKTRKIVMKLAENYSVSVISGRDLADVRNMVGIEDIAYAGSHGFDIVGPGGQYRDQERGKRFLPALDLAEKEMTRPLPSGRQEQAG
jgi:alpha,alpha-trehalase